MHIGFAWILFEMAQVYNKTLFFQNLQVNLFTEYKVDYLRLNNHIKQVDSIYSYTGDVIFTLKATESFVRITHF